MLKTIALIGLSVALALPPVSAIAQTGYGVSKHRSVYVNF
jgi:hypothetical protein